MEEDVKLCQICEEEPATCMGGVCLKCDHLLGDMEDQCPTD